MKSNNPWTDNKNRNLQMRLAKEVRTGLTALEVYGARLPRKRKKVLDNIHRNFYISLVTSMYSTLDEDVWED